jgi:hypothetical protein
MKLPKKLEDYLNWEFGSGVKTTRDFKKFALLFLNHIRKNLPKGAKLDKYSIGHYFIWGFIKRKNNYVYFFVNDVRYYKNDWYNKILLKPALNTEEIGSECYYCNLKEFKHLVNTLLNRGVHENHINPKNNK